MLAWATTQACVRTPDMSQGLHQGQVAVQWCIHSTFHEKILGRRTDLMSVLIQTARKSNFSPT